MATSKITKYLTLTIKWVKAKVLSAELRPIEFIVLFSIAYVLLAYRGDGLTMIGDYVIPLHPLNYLARMASPTDLWSGFGSNLPPIFSLPPLPDTLFFGFFSLFNLNIYLINKIYLFFLVLASALSVYFLSTTVFRNFRYKNVAGVASAIAFLFNPLMIADSYHGMIFRVLVLSQTGLILFLFLTIKYFQSGKIRFAILAGLSTFLMLSTPGLGAYQMAFFGFVGFVLITAYYLLTRSPNLSVKSFLVIFSCVVGLGFILNSYWMLAFLGNSSEYASFASSFQVKTIFNNYSGISNTIRLMNYWGFYSGYVTYASVFINNVALVALTYSWPVLAFIPLLWKDFRKSRKCISLFLITLIAVVIGCGNNPPLGQFYLSAVNFSFGGLALFKPFYTTIAVSFHVLTLLYSLLIGASICLLYGTLINLKLSKSLVINRKRNRIIGAFAIILAFSVLMTSSWPILTGDVMRSWYNPSQYGVRIPDYYWEANNQLKKVGSFENKTLLIPQTMVYVGTTWGYQGASQFYNRMFDVPIITGNEIAYRMTIDQQKLSAVYSDYYVFSSFANINILNNTSKIVPWQDDVFEIDNAFLSVTFNSTSSPDKWHSIELILPYNFDFLNFTHVFLELSGNIDLERFKIGLMDDKRNVGWWYSQDYEYSVDNGTFSPRNGSAELTYNSEDKSLLLDIAHPDKGFFSAQNVTSVWLKYFCTEFSNDTIWIKNLQISQLVRNARYYSRIWASNQIKYIIVDLSIKDGTKNNPHEFLKMLSDSDFFSLIWNKENLHLFSNNYGENNSETELRYAR